MAYNLAQNRRYQKFVADRNRAHENLHIKTQLRISELLHQALVATRELAQAKFKNLKTTGIYSAEGRLALNNLQMSMETIFAAISPAILEEIKNMRRRIYVLTYASEAEAIGQALNIKARYDLPKQKIERHAQAETYSGGSMEARLQLTINKMIRKIMNAVELSIVQDLSDELFDERLYYVMPKLTKVPVQQRNLTVGKTLREADEDPAEDFSIGYIDDESWDNWVEEYKREVVPQWRGPEYGWKVKTKTGKYETMYAWELEREITQDFVWQVRNGQVEAAKENGITDYVWVAVVDNRTDDCCLWRDGLTIAEIERKLKTERADDDCQALVPPAHFNCRCVLAPMVEEMPERPEDNTKTFEEWLDT